MMNLLRRLWKEEEGQGMVEYGLIIALIAIVVIGALGFIGTQLATSDDGTGTGIFDRIGDALDGE